MQKKKKKKFRLNELSKIFDNIENAKNIMLEADPNLEIYHSAGEKEMLTLYHKLYSKKTRNVQATLSKIFIKEQNT